MRTPPVFSICHASARPQRWRRAYDAWAARADHPQNLEYILCVDSHWGFPKDFNPKPGWIQVVHHDGPKGAVPAWNAACAASTGRVLILNSDDMDCPRHWDTKLLRAIPNLDADFVVEVTSSENAAVARVMVLGILSRVRYQRLGYAYYPGYTSMYADNEFTEHAWKDGAVIDARHLEFHHSHPAYGEGEWDPVYVHQNMPQNYDAGLLLLESRRAAGFPALVPEVVAEVAG